MDSDHHLLDLQLNTSSNICYSWGAQYLCYFITVPFSYFFILLVVFWFIYCVTHLCHSRPHQSHRRVHCRPGHRICQPARSWHSLDCSTISPQHLPDHLQTAIPAPQPLRSHLDQPHQRIDCSLLHLSERRITTLNIHNTNILIYKRRHNGVGFFTQAVSSIPVTSRVVAGLVTVPIFDPGSWAAFCTVRNWPGEVNLRSRKWTVRHISGWTSLWALFTLCRHLLPFRVAVEVIWPHVFAEHHIVVEVNELLGEPGDAMDVGLNSRWAESGKVAVVQEDILAIKEEQLAIIAKYKSFYDKYVFLEGKKKECFFVFKLQLLLLFQGVYINIVEIKA